MTAWANGWPGALGLALLAGPAVAQDDVVLLNERAADERPTLLVVGSAHLANPGRDVVNVQIEDVLAEPRQAEIAEVVRQLAAFAPTHVAVEWPAEAQDALDARYRDYLDGRYELSRNETDQLGLRLAAEAGLDRVHAVDWSRDPPGGEALYHWPNYGNAHGQEALIAALFDPERSWSSPTLEGRSVAAFLLALNTPEERAASHRPYFDVARVGDEEAQVGANWVGSWYARNLRIFNHLVDIAARSEDRVVVIYGFGHAYLLNQFAEESGAFRRAEVADVITDADAP